jgi:hypothetical protein
MSTEELIKQAFDKQADRAGDHRRVLAEVTRRTSSRRRIGALRIALLTVGVAAAVATPVVLFTGGEEPVSVEPAVPGSRPADVVPPGTPVLKYVPGWLPDEMVEDLREVLLDGSLVRGWSVPGTGKGTDNGGGQEIELKFEKSSKLRTGGGFDGAEAVDINGNQGQVTPVRGAQRQGVVEWLVGDEGKLTLKVLGLPDARQIALSIARSVRADSDAAFVRTVTFGWLPAGFSPGSYSVRGTSKPYVIAETMLDGSVQSHYGVVAQISPDKPATDIPGPGVEVTVRGKRGVYLTKDDPLFVGEVLVELKPGQWLQVRGSLGKDDLVKVADGLTLMHDPKFPWLGR